MGREALKAITDTVMVIPFDMKRLSADFDSKVKIDAEKVKGTMFAPTLTPNTRLVIHDKIALIKGTNIVVDNECVGEIHSENVSISVYEESIDECGMKSIFLVPRFVINPKLKELVNEYALPEISLTEFMGDRFAYNTRVFSNTKMIMKELKLV